MNFLQIIIMRYSVLIQNLADSSWCEHTAGNLLDFLSVPFDTEIKYLLKVQHQKTEEDF